MLKIETRLDPVEINGSAVEGLPNEADQVIVSAHHIRNRWVIINFHGKAVTVRARELQGAIANATNHD